MRVENVQLLEEVKYDIEDGERFYNSIEKGIGSYFRDSIIADIESLMLYAGIHHKHFGYYKMFSKRFPYAIYYDIIERTAIVVGVLDMRISPIRLKRKIGKQPYYK